MTVATVQVRWEDLESLRQIRKAVGQLGELAVELFDGPGTGFTMAVDDLDVLISRCEDALQGTVFDEIARAEGFRVIGGER